MSTEKKKPGPWLQIAAGIVVLAAITGYYLFEATARKAGPEEAAAVAAAPAPHLVRHRNSFIGPEKSRA